MAQLTPNAIEEIMAGNKDFKPTVQVTSIRTIGQNTDSKLRFRTNLSDGKFFLQAMMATQMNKKMQEEGLKEGGIIFLEEFMCNTVQGKKILIVLSMNIILPTAPMIGDPRPFPTSDSTAAAEAPAGSEESLARPMKQAKVDHSSQAYRASGVGGHSDQKPVHQQLGGYSNQRNQHSQYGGEIDQKPQNLPHGSVPKSNFQSSRMPASSAYSATVSPMYAAKGAIARNEAPARIVPVQSLNPYMGKWTIKVRVTSSGEVRRFSNSRGEGKVWSFDVLDADGGEMRVTCFSREVEKFVDVIEVGKVYLISKGRVQPAQKLYNHLKNDWELQLDSSSEVEACFDDGSIQKVQFSFCKLSSIEELPNNEIVDVIGVVPSVQPVQNITRKNGSETLKRSCMLRDGSGCQLELTMWGHFCNNEGSELQRLCDSGKNPVLAVKAARISDFSGKSLGTISTSVLAINPDLPEAHSLASWFQSGGRSMPTQNLSEGVRMGARQEKRRLLSAIKDEGLGLGEKPDWILVRATIAFAKPDNFYYTACPLKSGDRQCNKKVQLDGGGKFRCEKCATSMDECDYRYILSLQVQDHTGMMWVTLFQEAAFELLKVTAKQMVEWKENDDPRFAETFAQVQFTDWLFQMKVKEETWQEESRVKSTIVRVDPIDYASECHIRLDYISKLQKGEPISSPPDQHPSKIAPGVGRGFGAQEHIAPRRDFGQTGAASYGVSDGAHVGVNRHGGGAHGGGTYGGGAHGGGVYGGGAYEGGTYGGGGYGGAGAYGSGSGYGGSGGAGGGACYKCGEPGHFSRDCPARGGASTGGRGSGGGFGSGSERGGSGNECFKCGGQGHWASNCPNQSKGSGRGEDGGGYGSSRGHGYY